MLKYLFLIFIFPISLQAQIKIDHAGDFWEVKVQEALDKIKSIDSTSYNVIVNSCDNISFWNGAFSTNSGGGIGMKGTIIVSRRDIEIGDINNICAVLVHESSHLMVRMNGQKMSENEEEIICYKAELTYLLKVPDVGIYLINHAGNQILKRESARN